MSLRRKRRVSRACLKANRVIECPSPTECPKCGKGTIKPNRRSLQVKTVRDLKFFRGGVKRWVVRYSTSRNVCRSCGHTCYSPDYPTKQPKFGHGMASWAVYQHVGLRQSLEAVTASVNDVFGYSFSEWMVQEAHSMLAETHAATESLLLSKLRSGNLICGDEAKIKIKRGVVGYVWAFSGPEVVIYRFSREPRCYGLGRSSERVQRGLGIRLSTASTTRHRVRSRSASFIWFGTSMTIC